MDGLTEHLMYTSINNMKIINSEGTGLILRYRSKLQARPWRYFIFRGLLFVLILFIFIYILTKPNKLTRKWTSFGMLIYTTLVFERKSPEGGGRGNGAILFF